MSSKVNRYGLKLLTIARRIMKGIVKKSPSVFKYGVEEQKMILSRLRDPQGLFDRSYYQYYCQMRQTPVWVKIILNIASFLLFTFYYVKYYKHSPIAINKETQSVAVFFDAGETINIIPSSLQAEFDKIITCSYNDMILIGSEERYIIKQLMMRYRFKPYFVTKCMLKIGLYAYQIRNHKPQAIITCSEYSFTVSVLTEYCHYMGVEHINVMHGEKLFNIRDSFVQFDRYYVWDQHYIDLLVELRASQEQFVIEAPKSAKSLDHKNTELEYEYTYYLGAESEQELLKIKGNLRKLNTTDDKICIRYHPRYSNERQMKQIFSGYAIENPHEVPIETSVFRTKYIVSLYSTVLYQAYTSGKQIIIDDVTNPSKYLQLAKLKYIMINKPHIQLSEIIGE